MATAESDADKACYDSSAYDIECEKPPVVTGDAAAMDEAICEVVPGITDAMRKANISPDLQAKICAWCDEKGAIWITELLDEENFNRLASDVGIQDEEAKRFYELLESCEDLEAGDANTRTTNGGDLDFDLPSRDSCASQTVKASCSNAPSGCSFSRKSNMDFCIGDTVEHEISAISRASWMTNESKSSFFWHRQHLGRPRRVVFIRHGESEANVDREITARASDHCLHLTQKGRAQACEAGQRLREVVGDESIKFIVSPYVRTRETLNGILKAGSWDISKVDIREDVRIREQEYGNFDRADMRELHKEKRQFGAFYYRFPEGESPADCYDRASLFLESLYRSWEDNTVENLVVVGHGLMILVVIMRFFRIPVKDYDSFESLKNCEFIVLQRPEHDPKFDIAYTWALGEEKIHGRGLRRKENSTGKDGPKIWDGTLEAPMLRSVAVIPSKADAGTVAPVIAPELPAIAAELAVAA